MGRKAVVVGDQFNDHRLHPRSAALLGTVRTDRCRILGLGTPCAIRSLWECYAGLAMSFGRSSDRISNYRCTRRLRVRCRRAQRHTGDVVPLALSVGTVVPNLVDDISVGVRRIVGDRKRTCGTSHSMAAGAFSRPLDDCDELCVLLLGHVHVASRNCHVAHLPLSVSPSSSVYFHRRLCMLLGHPTSHIYTLLTLDAAHPNPSTNLTPSRPVVSSHSPIFLQLIEFRFPRFTSTEPLCDRFVGPMLLGNRARAWVRFLGTM